MYRNNSSKILNCGHNNTSTNISISIWIMIFSVGFTLIFAPKAIATEPILPNVTSGNLYLHLQADSLALSNGSAVTSWTDSVAGNKFTGNAVYAENVFNGHPAIKFNGTNQVLQDKSLNSTELPNTSSVTAFVVGQFMSSTDIDYMMGCQYSYVDNGDNRLRMAKRKDDWVTRIGDGPANINIPGADFDMHVFTLVSGQNNTNAAKMLVDTETVSVFTHGTTKNCMNLSRIALGAFNPDDSIEKYANCYISEVLIYKGALTDADIAEVNTFLIDKYNETILPPDNDDCVNALPVALDVPVSGSTIMSTGTTNVCNSSNDIWYYYDADFTGQVDITLTDASFDSVLVVLDNCGGNLLAANNDIRSFDDGQWYRVSYYNILQPKIEHLEVQQGRRYLISIGGNMGDTGSFILHISKSIVNDVEACDLNHDGIVTLFDIASLCRFWLTDNVVADIAQSYGVVDLSDLAEIAHCWLQQTNFSQRQAADISTEQIVCASTDDSYGTIHTMDPHIYPDFANLNWYKFQTEHSQLVTISVTNCNFDAALCVLDQFNGSIIAFNDDNDGELAPSISLEVVSGNAYYIVVGGFCGSRGKYELSMISEL